MNLAALEIPETTDELAPWLERHLLGSDLLDVVALLEAFRLQTDDSQSLAAICGTRLPAVLSQGLTALSPEQLRELLRHPRRLIELQQLILVDGADYWTSPAFAAVDEQTTTGNWGRLKPALATGRQPQKVPAAVGADIRRRKSTWWLTAVAAMVAIGIGVLQPWKSSGWGWDAPGVLAVNLPADAYLEHLATRADEYFQRPRESREQLKRTVGEFRHSCDTLIKSEHPQLAEADRGWLRERCGAWAKKLDGHLAELEKTGDVAQVRTQADGTIRTLIQKLRERAKERGHA